MTRLPVEAHAQQEAEDEFVFLEKPPWNIAVHGQSDPIYQDLESQRQLVHWLCHLNHCTEYLEKYWKNY